MGSVLVVSLVAGAIAVGLVMNNRAPAAGTAEPTAADGSVSPGAQPTDLPASPQLVAPAGSGAPTNVRLTDNGDSVTVRWVDPTSAGTLPFAVSTRTRAGKYLPAVTVPAGRSSAVVHGLDPEQDYCFIVTAIYSADTLAPADPVCTAR
ncbi:fibronectin type III domain-containing protein [Luedemannella flava]